MSDNVLRVRWPYLNPHLDTCNLSNAFDWFIAHNLVGTLNFNDEVGDPLPFLANFWQISKDGKEVTFDVDPSARFQNS